MGKFLRDSQGNPVAIDGGLVLERTLDRKPRDCESCGFNKWAKKDKVFIIQGGTGISAASNGETTDTSSSEGATTAKPLVGFAGGGSMEWICPDCALKRGLPMEFYHKNFYAPGNEEARQKNGKKLKGGINKLLDMTSSLCSF